ncbi:hypothetical protein [Treponema pedis]|uniref:Peptidase S41 n=1 Tax=Treponema pedis TaxID=409322 RepID=A0A7S6WP91_9SPIR|nr:hypothetical protein [Treponema pedis]QOW60813.1 hypothetical protein IFE08_13695 [Treponema pedis]
MKKIIFTLFLFTAVICTAEQSTGTDILDKVSGCIKKNHVNPFTEITEAEFNAEIKTLKSEWNKKNETEKYFALRGLIALLGDSHTQIVGTPFPQDALPFFVLPYGGHSIIVQAQNEYGELAGKELIAINGIEIKTVLKNLMPIISYDTEGYAELKAHYECRLSSSLKFTKVIKSSEKIDITVKDVLTGEIKTFKIGFLKSGQQITNPVFARFAPTLFQSGYYRADFIRDEILFIQYNICSDYSELPMSKFVSILKNKLKEKAPKKIIIDLRHNQGGDSTVIKPLIEMLKLFLKNGSAVFCLIGGETFSSGVMAAEDLKNIGAVLIGEKCGWNGRFGEVKELSLSDNLTLLYSVKDFSAYFKNGIVQPDKVVLPDLKDLANGIDTCIEYIKQNYN